jgi:hypothetical protein
VPSSAVPASVIAQGDGTLGPVAVPAALQAIVDPFSDASAVPATIRLFRHVALNNPLAVVDVRSVTVHLKSVQEEAEGATVADAHAPMSALTPALEGLVGELVCSYPPQPATAAAIRTEKPQAKRRFFMRPVESSQEPRVVGTSSIADTLPSQSAANTIDPGPYSGAARLPRNVPDAIEIVAKRLGRTAEGELVPRDRIGLEEPGLQAFLVAAQLAAHDRRGVDDNNR